MRYILWQRVTYPPSIVGSIHAESIADAASLARVMCGSFWVTAWWSATGDDRAKAIRQDQRANALGEPAAMT